MIEDPLSFIVQTLGGFSSSSSSQNLSSNPISGQKEWLEQKNCNSVWPVEKNCNRVTELKIFLQLHGQLHNVRYPVGPGSSLATSDKGMDIYGPYVCNCLLKIKIQYYKYQLNLTCCSNCSNLGTVLS